jgi:hypothetical protein
MSGLKETAEASAAGRSDEGKKSAMGSPDAFELRIALTDDELDSK